MKLIAIYTKEGRIDRLLSCPENLIAANIQLNEFWLEAPEGISDSTYRVVNGAFVPFPPKPAAYYVWDWLRNEWVDPRTPETQWPIVRADRNRRLQETDWTQLADIPQETKTLWEPYRQALRDITDQLDPFNIIWPTPPTA